MQISRKKIEQIIRKDVILFEKRLRILKESNGQGLDLFSMGLEYIMSDDSRVTEQDFDRYIDTARSVFPRYVVEGLLDIVEDSQSSFMISISEIVNGVNTARGMSPLNETAGDATVRTLEKYGAPIGSISAAQSSVANVFSDAALSSGEYAIGEQMSPTIKEFLKSFMSKAVKSFTFGFIDNFILIIAGNSIDAVLGDSMGLSPMASAGIGNALSDAVGELGGETIDNTLTRMGVTEGVLSDKALESSPDWMRVMHKNAGVIGIVIGCLIGMVPLMFMKSRKSSS